jgi:hypothetical protein
LTASFDDIVMKYFYAAVVAGETTAELPLWRGPHTQSTMTMQKQLLRMFISCGGTRSYFLDLILLALNRCAELFPGIGSSDDIGEVREIYLNGILETCTGLIGGNTLACLLAPPEEDCLDDRRKSGDELYVILMAAAYLGRIEDLKLLVTLGLDVNRNHESTWLYPPLIAASFGGNETAAKFLVEHGADPHTVK